MLSKSRTALQGRPYLPRRQGPGGNYQWARGQARDRGTGMVCQRMNGHQVIRPALGRGPPHLRGQTFWSSTPGLGAESLESPISIGRIADGSWMHHNSLAESPIDGIMKTE